MAKPTVNFLIIGTGKYSEMAQECSNNLKKFGKDQLDVRTTLLSDMGHAYAIHEDMIGPQIFNEHIQIDHLPWPIITLLRYFTFTKYKSSLLGGGFLGNPDYTYYIDADLHPVAPFGAEILGDRAFTIHPGFASQPRANWTYDKTPWSKAYMGPDEGRRYYIGALQGGRTSEFYKMCEILSYRVNQDLRNNYIALWHDESHMNRYAWENPPDKELGVEFCWPEEWIGQGGVTPKFVALKKNHNELRKEV